MAFCLLPKYAQIFKEKIKSGELNPEKLSNMTSAERHAYFSEFLGEANAKHVNAAFESKLLLKHQQQGIISWAQSIAGLKPEVQRDILSRVQRMTKVLEPKELNAFLSDLAEQKLGFGVSMEEAGKISELAKEVADAKVKIQPDSPSASPDRLEYGLKVNLFKDYVNGLKSEATKLKLKDYIKNPAEIIYTLSGSVKSVVASFDNSFFGRQGIKTLYTNPDIWIKSFAKSFKDMGKQIVAKGKWYGPGDDAVMLAVKSDIVSRPNAINGKYKAGGFALDVLSEEAFPTSLPERIPIFGRLFKASEAAYNAAALRIRADYADRIIAQAEAAGVNTLVKAESEGIGQLVNALTGRGKVSLTEGQARKVNATFFSIKFLKSNWDVLTAHGAFNPLSGHFVEFTGPESFARRKAATNLLKVLGGIVAINTLAEVLHPGSTEPDPRGTNFARIQIGKHHFDISGGMTSLITLAARITPTKHDGVWGFWTKNKEGKYTQLSTGKYGVRTALDVIDDFWQGKLSPLAGVLRDKLNGEMFGGQAPTLANEAKQILQPISIQNFEDLMKEGTAAELFLATMILDGLGFNMDSLTPKKQSSTKQQSSNLGR